jgi:probable phosphoglycerate mutase
MLAVVRHGRAHGNTSHRFIGWSDVELDDHGVRQAQLVARRLASAGIERIVSSDIVRAMQTAMPLGELTGLPVEPDPRLREVANGQWTGLLPSEIAERWPDMWQAYISGTDVTRPDGERWQDVRIRVRDAVSELAQDGRATAVFTHGGPMILTAEWALDLELPGNIFRGPLAVPDNTAITVIEDGRLVSYGDAGHLGTLAHLDIPYANVE